MYVIYVCMDCMFTLLICRRIYSGLNHSLKVGQLRFYLLRPLEQRQKFSLLVYFLAVHFLVLFTFKCYSRTFPLTAANISSIYMANLDNHFVWIPIID